MWHSGWHRHDWRRAPRFAPEWEHKRRFLFIRFAWLLAWVVLIFILGIGGLAFLITRLFGGDNQTVLLVWLSGCAMAVVLPLLLGGLAFRSFVRLANPLARVMAAADAVAEGDLSARVPEGGPGEIGKLSASFNRMVAELQRSDQQRRNLTADVAHELRTPLHIIQGNLEGIQDGIYTPTPEYIDMLLDETHQLARLVEDLRTLSLAEAGQLPLIQETIAVRELLEDVNTSFGDQAAAAQVDLRLEIEPGIEPLQVVGDAGRLDQVLSNLVANALRHTHAGGFIRLRAERTEDGVRLQVTDDGDGIEAADLPYVFDRFWRGQATAENASPTGSGLGLAIARQLVQAHGGKIRVESQPGQGSTFTIDLPVPQGRLDETE